MRPEFTKLLRRLERAEADCNRADEVRRKVRNKLRTTPEFQALIKLLVAATGVRREFIEWATLIRNGKWLAVEYELFDPDHFKSICKSIWLDRIPSSILRNFQKAVPGLKGLSFEEVLRKVGGSGPRPVPAKGNEENAK